MGLEIYKYLPPEPARTSRTLRLDSQPVSGPLVPIATAQGLDGLPVVRFQANSCPVAG